MHLSIRMICKLGLDEDEEGFDKETIRNELYEHILSHQGEGYFIVVDKLNAVSAIDFETEGINVITYQKKRWSHLWRCFPSWRKDIPKEAR